MAGLGSRRLVATCLSPSPFMNWLKPNWGSFARYQPCKQHLVNLVELLAFASLFQSSMELLAFISRFRVHWTEDGVVDRWVSKQSRKLGFLCSYSWASSPSYLVNQGFGITPVLRIGLMQFPSCLSAISSFRLWNMVWFALRISAFVILFWSFWVAFVGEL